VPLLLPGVVRVGVKAVDGSTNPSQGKYDLQAIVSLSLASLRNTWQRGEAKLELTSLTVTVLAFLYSTTAEQISRT